ncbi:hypothetical protein [Pseudomonas turukhanskensis]|uniref:Uncharacterized protein n=1 Tax=Pseudomonas turukhanskensis TaxID=1806536 RepID=A0A9W6K6A1_9PSED|nr:hypothetical protein [Pseudomonas turukhanskensis]GLK90256.1 hypothetical protein GCM10017655_33180 [Pseudomonas turukhanskensis]
MLQLHLRFLPALLLGNGRNQLLHLLRKGLFDLLPNTLVGMPDRA